MTQYLPKIKLGDKFGKLTVLYVDGKRNRNLSYLCQCECGNTKSVASHHLKSGNIKSCGCYAVECARKQHALNFVTHGMSQKSEFNIWQHMKDRCNNPNNDSYKYYGERGISVCERWLHSFEAFYADMGPRPSRGHSIDRIDVNGNYEPGNCRWATKQEQARNRRNNVIIGFGGRKIILKAFSDICGISISRARYLLSQGYTPDEIYLTIKYKHTKRISRNTVNIIVDKNYPINYDEIFGGQKYIPIEVIDTVPEFDIHKIKLL